MGLKLRGLVGFSDSRTFLVAPVTTDLEYDDVVDELLDVVVVRRLLPQLVGLSVQNKIDQPKKVGEGGAMSDILGLKTHFLILSLVY